MKSRSKCCASLSKFTSYSMVLVAAISGAAVVGWLFDYLVIASIHRSFIPMAPTTALFFLILCSAHLVQLRFPDHPAARKVALLAALFVAVISMAIFCDYFIDAVKLNIEGVIPFAAGKLAAVPTGRMSPISAASFMLSGLALFFLSCSFRDSRLTRQASALLAGTVAASGAVVLTGYLHGSPLLYGSAIIPVALPTAVAFIALGSGLCASAGADVFPQQHFLGESIGSRMMRAFMPITVAIVVAQGMLGARFYSGVSNPSLISSLMTLLSVAVVGFVVTAISKIISHQLETVETERKLAQQELAESEERFRAFFENSIDAIFFSSAGGIIHSANPEACRIFGMTQAQICSVGWDGLVDQDSLLHEALAERLRTGKYRGELTGKGRDGTRFPIEISSSVFRNRAGDEMISTTARDVTEQKRAQEELREINKRLNVLSNTDPLTKLYNRRYLMESFDREMKRQKRSNSFLTVLLIDVDRFKIVNDVFGHQRGDEVLVAVAEAAREMLRCNDIAARYGGEEFVLLLPETSLSGGVVAAERLREAVRAISFAAPMENLAVTVSIGVATFPSPSIDGVDALLQKADEALYRAKNGGRNRVAAMTDTLQLTSVNQSDQRSM
ncbi:MAG: hypothetical protein A2075_13775 [Geobacteraceae bacterium GWC2_58_44]|nr:MAG: hypothetical protein A2075_13775 [Geobacteraceae bacterium GWC2_58_44]HBG06579.1 hypothetical protein [Geobacter sp.]